MYTCPKGHPSHDADYCDECGTPMAATISVRPVTLAERPPAQTCPQCGTGKVGRFCEVCGHDFLLAGIAPTTFRPGGAPSATSSGTVPAGDPAPADGLVGTVGPAPRTMIPAQRAGDVTPLPWTTGSGTGAAPATVPPEASAGPRQWRLVATSDPAYHAMMQANAEPGSTPIPFPAYCPERRFTLSGRQVLIGRRSRTRGIEPEVDLSGPPADPAVSHTHALLLFQPATGWAVVDLESANGTYLNDDPDPIAANLPITLADGDRIHVGAWTTLTVYTA